jgi:hypothetical protein
VLSEDFPVMKARIVVLALFGVLVCRPALAWYKEGHKIVAIIAADNLGPAARSHVAQILDVPANKRSIEEAMAAVSNRPDNEFRQEDRSTAAWHFIDICMQDNQTELGARCPGGNCVTAKIDEYAWRLRRQDYDKWGAAGDLAFLIHFVGDIHQPLHAANNADRGGTCQAVNVEPAEENLHYAWDDAVVVNLEQQLGTHVPQATARKLEAHYPERADSFTWQRGTSQQIAWETHELADRDVYGALGIPERPCEMQTCDPATRTAITLSPAYMKRAGDIAGHQLAKAGYRLAVLLNQIWPSAVPPH